MNGQHMKYGGQHGCIAPRCALQVLRTYSLMSQPPARDFKS